MKRPFEFVRKWVETRTNPRTNSPERRTFFEYRASFWDGPVEAGQPGRYRHLLVRDELVHGRPLLTAPNATYFDQLMRAVSR